MIDKQGWILRNSVVWNKVKSGMDTTKDRLGNVHENVFHFVKQAKYYYNVDSIRSKPCSEGGERSSSVGYGGNWSPIPTTNRVVDSVI